MKVIDRLRVPINYDCWDCELYNPKTSSCKIPTISMEMNLNRYYKDAYGAFIIQRTKNNQFIICGDYSLRVKT